MDQAANGYDSPLDGNIPLVPAKEAKETDDGPVNAGLLTMLFLAASFFGLSASRRLLANHAQGQGASCSSSGVVGEAVGGTREGRLLFLGVFRL